MVHGQIETHQSQNFAIRKKLPATQHFLQKLTCTLALSIIFKVSIKWTLIKIIIAIIIIDNNN